MGETAAVADPRVPDTVGAQRQELRDPVPLPGDLGAGGGGGDVAHDAHHRASHWRSHASFARWASALGGSSRTAGVGSAKKSPLP